MVSSMPWNVRRICCKPRRTLASTVGRHLRLGCPHLMVRVHNIAHVQCPLLRNSDHRVMNSHHSPEQDHSSEHAGEACADDLNDVRLRGRLSAEAEIRELPSGDSMAVWRLIVSRPAEARGSVDSIDCVSTRIRVIRSVQAAVPGQRLELSGALRRRFWRTPAGPQSRYAVDVATVRRIRLGR